MQKQRQLFLKSLGHGNHSLSTFLDKLRDNGVEHVIDVRSYPFSHRHPHFSQKPLQEALTLAHIQYTFYGDRLGGRGANRDYEGAIKELVRMVQRGEQMCVLCSESDPTKCHRSKMLEPPFAQHGVEMRHILYEEGEH
jgi:uncharacterized protein (DUF488 family)